MNILTESAAIRRINRRLKPRGQQLRAMRAEWDRHTGRHYIVDVARNVVVERHVRLLSLALELDVLNPGETLKIETLGGEA